MILRAAPMLLLSLLISLAAPLVRAGETLAGPYRGQVERVIDGDSLLVRVHIWLGQEVSTIVRLRGIDAPELKGRCEAERAGLKQRAVFLPMRLPTARSCLRPSKMTSSAAA